MFRIFKTHIENAVESLGANRMRTFLTMLGVMIGIASITAIFALSGGISSLISRQVSSEGAMVVVRPKEIGEHESLITSLTAQKSFVKSSLTEKDVEAVASAKNVTAAAPLATFSGTITAEDKNLTTQILATNSNLEKVISLKMRHEGEFLADSSKSKNVVIGYQLALDLFGTPDADGRNMKIKGETFLVIGVIERQNSAINFSNTDFDKLAIIDFDTAKELSSDNLQIQQINAKINSINNLGSTDKQITEQISQNHKHEADFEVLSGEEIATNSNKMIEVAGTVLALVAGISLVVGGIGIMNIMLVNVSERTREIGIRKALGANNRQILMQFLTESMIIALGGGVFGFILGYAFSFGVSLILPFTPVVSWSVAIMIGLISIAVGVVFGIYPALRAARKDPIESLRQYN